MFCCGRLGEACFFFRQALKLSDGVGDESLIARALLQLGRVLHCLRYFAEAMAAMSSALKISKEIGDVQLEAFASHGQAAALEGLRWNPEAMELLPQLQVLYARYVRQRSRPGPSHVVLLKYTRSPSAFRAELLSAPQLAQCRKALETHGFQVEIESGAKMFVKPEEYRAAVETIRVNRWELYPDHIVVTPDLEQTVMSVVQGLPKKWRVYFKERTLLPLGFAAASLQIPASALVSNTFINFRVPPTPVPLPADMFKTCSTTDFDPRNGCSPRATCMAPDVFKTASTTDVNPRKGCNPRACRARLDTNFVFA